MRWGSAWADLPEGDRLKGGLGARQLQGRAPWSSQAPQWLPGILWPFVRLPAVERGRFFLTRGLAQEQAAGLFPDPPRHTVLQLTPLLPSARQQRGVSSRPPSAHALLAGGAMPMPTEPCGHGRPGHKKPLPPHPSQQPP